MPHINEKIDFTIGAYIVFEDKVLLILHKQLKKWLPVGGHIELDEDPEQALLREIKEESGLEVEIVASKPNLESPGTKFLPTPEYLDIHEISNSHKHIGMVYFAKAITENVMLQEAEHDDIRWFSQADLEDTTLNLTPAVKFYCQKALEKLAIG